MGWLARENKVRFCSDSSGMISVEVNIPLTETYY
ncbi:MAG: hypothetical protein LUH01_11780 [Parabacteroides gordonii]|nr:hypothetical protein [Parabacteroides gordonii]